VTLSCQRHCTDIVAMDNSRKTKLTRFYSPHCRLYHVIDSTSTNIQVTLLNSASVYADRSKIWKSQIAHLDMHHLVFGINFQIHSVSLTILVLIHLLIHFSTHLCHHPHSRHPSLLLSFTPGSKPPFSTNPSHRRFLLPTGLSHDNGTEPDLSRSLFYF